MAIFDNHQSWLPEETNDECSLGLCTIHCPQWCYHLFPPSPPFSHAATFSPLLFATIAVLAAFSLLIAYRKLTSSFCRSSHSRRPTAPTDNSEEEIGSEDSHQESWHLPPSTGLDWSLIRKITICKYKRGEGLVDGTECAVCLSEFVEGENLRLLPKCSHAFHVRCVDTWLEWHSNCPLCRANILALEEEEEEEVVIDVQDFDLEVKEAKDCCRIVRAGSSRRGRGERGKVRSRGLHSVLSTVRMKRSVSSGRSLFARRGRGRALLLPV